MSRENVESFTSIVEALNRMAQAGEPNEGDLRRFFEDLDPAIEFAPQQAALEGGYVGHEGVLRWIADLMEHYAGGRIEIRDIRDLDDRVLALGTLRLVGKSSGIEAEVPVAFVARYRDGLMIECRDYGDHGRALDAAGLPG